MEATSDSYFEHFCPSCGQDNCIMVYEIGWCLQCVREHHPTLKVCDCGNLVNAGSYGNHCRKCKDNFWLEKHADELEAYMEKGISFNKAREQVYRDNRPTCLSCGDRIVKGRTDGGYYQYFCMKPVCRQWYHEYKLILRKPNISQDDALVIIREQLCSNREIPA